MVKGLLHAALCTADMDASLRFYCEVLGGVRIVQVEEPAGSPLMELVRFADGTCVELFHPRPDAAMGSGWGRNHLCFSVGDIKALEQALRRAGFEPEAPPKIARDGNWQLWCTDPNGYRVEFMQLMPGCPQCSNGPLVKLK